MAKNTPVKIWITRHNPSNDPKFHQVDKLLGAGRSNKLPFITLITGWIFRMGLNIFIRT